jgi:hypothetical protein
MKRKRKRKPTLYLFQARVTCTAIRDGCRLNRVPFILISRRWVLTHDELVSLWHKLFGADFTLISVDTIGTFDEAEASKADEGMVYEGEVYDGKFTSILGESL